MLCNHSKLHAKRAQHRIDGFKPWVCPSAQGLVQTLSAKSRVFRNLRHASRFCHIAERGNEYIGVWVFGGRRKIFRNDRIVIQIGRRVEWFVSCFPHSSSFIHFPFSLLYPFGYSHRIPMLPCRAIAREAIEEVCETRERRTISPRCAQRMGPLPGHGPARHQRRSRRLAVKAGSRQELGSSEMPSWILN